MNIAHNRFIGFVTLSFLTLCFSGTLEAATPNHRTFNFTYVVKVRDIPSGASRLNMWIPYPPSDEDQSILDVKIDSPYPVTVEHEPKYGNSALFITTDNPKKPFSINVVYTVDRVESLTRKVDPENDFYVHDSGQFRLFLEPSHYAVINDKVRKYSAEATAGKKGAIEKARAIYDWIVGHMNYNKQIPGFGKGDVNRACVMINGSGEGAGNCTDFHSLFASMMRVQNIPVKFEMGYPLTPGKDRKQLKAGGYHCWAKFYAAGLGWVPVDISEARKNPDKREYYWGSICENRFKFSEGRDIKFPRQAGEKLNYFGPDPYIEIDGKPFKGFERLTAFSNL